MIYLSHPTCLEHDPRAQMPAHPDTPERLWAIEAALHAAGGACVAPYWML